MGNVEINVLAVQFETVHEDKKLEWGGILAVQQESVQIYSRKNHHMDSYLTLPYIADDDIRIQEFIH